MPSLNTVVFTDHDVFNSDILLSGLTGTTLAHTLSNSGTPLLEIASRLQGLRDIERLVLLAHGEPGSIILSGKRVDTEALLQHTRTLDKIKAALAPDAEIVLASCSTGAGSAGDAFVETLERALGASVSAAETDVGGDAGWASLPMLSALLGDRALRSYPHRLSKFDFESNISGNNSTALKQTVDGVTLTITRSDGGTFKTSSTGGVSGVFADSGSVVSGTVTVSFTFEGTNTAAPLNVTALSYWEAAAPTATGGNYVIDPNTAATNEVIAETSISDFHSDRTPSGWDAISSFQISYSNGGNYFVGLDEITFTLVNSATTTAADFSTAGGTTNLTPSSVVFGAGNQTLTIAEAAHVNTSTGATADGGADTDTLVLAQTGTNLATSGFTLSNFEILTLNDGVSATMTGAQHDAFSSGINGTGTNTITLASAGGDSNITGDTDIESYVLNDAFTFTIGTVAQNVTGNDGASQTVQSTSSVDNLTGTLNGGAGQTDVLILDDGDNIAGATISNFETLEVGAGSVTMKESQHDGFTTINGTGTNTITLSAADSGGVVTGDADIETYNLNGAFTFTLSAVGQNVTGSAGDNQSVGSSGSIDILTGTLNGGTGGSDTLVADTGDDFTGAALSNFEVLSIADGATIKMTATQHAGFTSASATGTQTINISGNGAVTTKANIENYSIGDDTNLDDRGVNINHAAVNITTTSANDINRYTLNNNLNYTGTITDGGLGGQLTMNEYSSITQATLNNIVKVTVGSGPEVLMTAAQHNAFGTIDGVAGSNIKLDSGNIAVTGDADITGYLVGTSYTGTFTLGAATQNYTGGTGNDTLNAGSLTATGTLNGGDGTGDVLQLSSGANISGATVSGFENLTLSGGASVTMKETQHDAFSSVTAPGADIITISDATNGFQTAAAVEKYILGVANATTITGGAQEITGSTGNDTFTFQGLTYTGTLSGGAGTDVIQMTTGSNISGANISGVENLTLAGNASVTMTVSQLNTFAGGTINAGGTETVTLSGDGNVSTVSAIENYVVGDSTGSSRTVTITNAGHSVSATSDSDAVTFDAGGLTLTGTLTGEGTVNDILSISNGANISGATISAIEDLTLANNGSATMTVAQLNGFTGTITAAGTNTITLTTTGTISNSNLANIEAIATASGGSETITLAASTASGKTLTATDTGNDKFVVTGSAGAQTVTGSAGADTIDGGAGADTLGGGAGVDSLTGGADTDQFTGSASDLNGDTITDLAAGETILLTGVTGLSTANVRFNGSTLEIDTDATTFAAPEVTINTSTDLSSTLIASTVGDSGGNTLITLGSSSVSVTSTAAGFNTTTGTNTTPASALGSTSDTLTIASATHTTGSTADGGTGTDTLVLSADGTDLTQLTTLTGFETLTLGNNVGATMSESQHDAFTTINGGTGTETITLSSANGDGNVTGDADIETYNLNGAFTFTLGAAGQNVTGDAASSQTVKSSASIDTLTGTLNGGTGQSDTLVLDTGDNISGATVSGFENLTLDSGASVTMTAAQLNGFTGTVTAAGTETVTLTSGGSVTGANLSAIETLATASGGSETITMTAAQAAGTTLTATDAASDHFVVTGSAGAQNITGSAGADTIDGGDGADTISGGLGSDLISGGAGGDSLLGQDGVDSLFGFSGDDYIDGGAGSDHLAGGDGGDTLSGGDGADTISGDAGNDSIVGGAGQDVLIGGTGDDTFSGSASEFNADTISGIAAGDQIVISNADLSTLSGTTLGTSIELGGGSILNIADSPSNLTITATVTGGNSTLTFAAPASNNGGGGGNGSSGPVVVTDNPSDTSTGGARTITNNGSTSGSAAIVQNTGNNGNVVTATLPPSVSISSSGPSTAQTAESAQTTLVSAIQARNSTSEAPLTGGARTFLNNLGATTTLDVRTVIPTTTSSTTSDPIVITGTSNAGQSEAFVIDMRSMPSGSTLQLDNIEFASVMGQSTITGGAGQNYVTADDASQFISLGAEDDTLAGGGGADTVGSGFGEDIVYGNQGADSVFGGGGMDTVYGGQDGDTVLGDNDNDWVYGNKGDDTLLGGNGDDRLFGGQDNDIVYGNTGNDSISGNLGNDTLYGGQGNDLVSGGAGADIIVGNKGDDTLSGGEGADTFIFEFGGGNDQVADFQAGTDTLALQNGLGITGGVETNGSTTVTFSDGGTVTVIGVSKTDLAAATGWDLG
ncbi:DUF4347 domain-containing protein [Nisaea sediminum]|uniref:DUF4347 domain-containing protein n=1 Tax=Nisaea sediminum TaxID=2775867 RepID=UPI001D01F03C|nr:DUF4347 domain-containing protein [Nisaea sediminum]